MPDPDPKSDATLLLWIRNTGKESLLIQEVISV